MRIDGIVDVVKPVSGEQNEHLNVIGNITVQDLEVVVTLAKDVDGAVTQIKNVAGNIAGKDGGDLSEITVISGAEDSVQLPAAGYYGIGKVTVKGDKNLAPENIKKGKTIFGVDGDYAPDPVKLASLSRTFSRNGAYTISTPDGYTGLRKVDIKVDVPTKVIEEVVNAKFQSKTVTPSTKGQNITPDEESGFNALSSVYVEGDSDLKSENIVKGKTIFGVAGSYEKRELQSKTVTPNADGQTVKPDADFEGLSSVYVEGDSDLIPANIRKGANIFGVDGSYSTGMNYQDKSVTPNGKQITVSADKGFNALAKVTIEGDSNLTPENIAKGKTIFGVHGEYVSPMIEVLNIVPSDDGQYIIPPDGFEGFKSVMVEAVGGGGGGGGETKATHHLYGTPNSEGNVILQTFIGDMRFDGAVLPKLPEWDKEAYPYLTMRYEDPYYGSPYYGIVATKHPLVFTGSANSYASITPPYVYTVLNNGDTDWHEWMESDGTRHVPYGIFWTNYDMQRYDGSVLSCPAPIPLASDEPVANVYNGVKLPPLPEYDKEAYPYSCVKMVINAYGEHVFTHYACPNPINRQGDYYYAGGRPLTCQCRPDSEENSARVWSDLKEGFALTVKADELMWTSHDISYTEEYGGGLARSADPAPIPVYEQKE